MYLHAFHGFYLLHFILPKFKYRLVSADFQPIPIAVKIADPIILSDLDTRSITLTTSH